MALTALLRKALDGGRLVPAAAAICLLFQAAVAAAQPAPVDLTVREEHGTYSVVARFTVAQSPDVALTVLSDYAQIPRFMPGVRTSTVLERDGHHTVVEQEAVASIMMFSKRVHLVLEIDEQPDTLLFRDRCGRSFTRYEGAWRVSADSGHTTITYELTADPSFDIPGFVIKRLLRRDSSQMIERLQQEIAARVTPEHARQEGSGRRHAPQS
jgi:ribosome-associated toxin RatA of RatAB toxin-antitoxin module